MQKPLGEMISSRQETFLHVGNNVLPVVEHYCRDNMHISVNFLKLQTIPIELHSKIWYNISTAKK